MPRMRDKGIGGHHRAYRGRTDEWLTPREIVDDLGPFDLDPCAPIVRPWPTATVHYTEADDGLRMPWKGRVWLNPPYGPATGKWLRRMADHGDGIALIFARTETVAFHRQVWERADAFLFVEGRIHFCHPDGTRAKCNAGAPSVFVAYGRGAVEKLYGANVVGQFIRLRRGSGDG